MFPRVAFEYGQTPWAARTIDRLGRVVDRRERDVHVDGELEATLLGGEQLHLGRDGGVVGHELLAPPDRASALSKHAAKPTAKSCSGFVPPPSPPIPRAPAGRHRAVRPRMPVAGHPTALDLRLRRVQDLRHRSASVSGVQASTIFTPWSRRYGRLMADDLGLSDHAARTRSMWDEDAPNWVASGRADWARPSPTGAGGTFPRRRCASFPTCGAWTCSTSAAGRAIGAPGWLGWVRAPWGWTSRRPSSRPRARCSASTTRVPAAPRQRRSDTAARSFFRPSVPRSPGPRSGATRTSRYPRPIGSCARAGG